MEGLKGEAPKGPREVDLDQHIRDVEQAAADWGVHTDKLEGRFVSALLAAIATSGRANLAALGDIERLLEKASARGEGELRRLNGAISRTWSPPLIISRLLRRLS